MKAAVLALCLIAAAPLMAQLWHEPPDVAATTPYSDFPVHIHLYHVHWQNIRGTYEGYGRGDLLGPKPQGVDYTFSCSEPFLHNVGKAEFYQARWKKQDQRLEILMQKVGSDKLQKCELKTTLKPEPYGNAGDSGAASPAP
jgi:hypothetical protein